MTDHASETRSWTWALSIVSAAALLRLVFAALIPAFPDETYYWEWSRRLATGYFDHPPAIAWLIAFGVRAFPVSAFAVRFGPVLAGLIAALATVGMARRLGGSDSALRAAIVITVMPLAAAGLILATPDAPLLAAVAVCLYCVVRVLESPVGSRASLAWWTATGVTLGLAFTSKYTSIFLPLAVFAAVLVHPDLRARLREPGPYVACAVATLVFSPVLVWNSQHDWISFTHQIQHGLEAPGGSALRRAWRNEGDFFGGQAALASPILFIMLGIATGRAFWRRMSVERFVLAMVALVSFAFFIYSASRRRVEPNWPAPAYIPAIVLLATMELSSAGKRWFAAGVWLAGVMSALIYIQGVIPILPIPPAKDPIARAYGWRELTGRATTEATTTSAATRAMTWLGGDRYQEASELAFHASGHPTTFSMNVASRANQYDLWPRFQRVARAGDNLLLVVDDDDDGMHASVKAMSTQFSEVRKGELVQLRRGAAVIGTRRIWVLVGWNGVQAPGA